MRFGRRDVSGRGPLQVVSACYPPATQPDLWVALDAINTNEVRITRFLRVGIRCVPISDIATSRDYLVCQYQDSDTNSSIDLAILRLATSSSLIGSSIGKSLGFCPLRILTTKPATRRWFSASRSDSRYQLFFLAMAIARFLMVSASFGSSLSTWSKS